MTDYSQTTTTSQLSEVGNNRLLIFYGYRIVQFCNFDLATRWESNRKPEQNCDTACSEKNYIEDHKFGAMSRKRADSDSTLVFDDVYGQLPAKKSTKNDANRGQRIVRYSRADDLKIIEFVVRGNFETQTSGNAIWHKAQAEDLLVGRSWSSLRDHYLHVILPKIDRYAKWANVSTIKNALGLGDAHNKELSQNGVKNSGAKDKAQPEPELKPKAKAGNAQTSKAPDVRTGKENHSKLPRAVRIVSPSPPRATARARQSMIVVDDETTDEEVQTQRRPAPAARQKAESQDSNSQKHKAPQSKPATAAAGPSQRSPSRKQAQPQPSSKQSRSDGRPPQGLRSPVRSQSQPPRAHVRETPVCSLSLIGEGRVLNAAICKEVCRIRRRYEELERASKRARFSAPLGKQAKLKPKQTHSAPSVSKARQTSPTAPRSNVTIDDSASETESDVSVILGDDLILDSP